MPKKITPLPPASERALADFTRHLMGRHKSIATAKNYAYSARQFIKFHPKFHHVSEDDVLLWLAELRKRHLKPSTIKMALMGLRSFFIFLRIVDNPALKVPPPNVPRTIPPYLPREEMHKLINAPDATTTMGKRDRAIICLLLLCGMRRNEIVLLRLENLKLKESTIILRETKNGDDRAVMLNETARGAMEDWLKARGELRNRDGSKLKTDAVFPSKYGDLFGQFAHPTMIRDVLVQHAKSCGIEKIYPHLCRHSFATEAYAQTQDVISLSKALGHKDIQNTIRYTHVNNKQVRNIFDSVDPKRSAKEEDAG